MKKLSNILLSVIVAFTFFTVIGIGCYLTIYSLDFISKLFEINGSLFLLALTLLTIMAIAYQNITSDDRIKYDNEGDLI